MNFGLINGSKQLQCFVRWYYLYSSEVLIAQFVFAEKLKAVADQQKDENSNSVKVEECSEEEEEEDDEEEDDDDEEEEEEEEESESEEEGVMLAGRLAVDPQVVKAVTDQEVPNLMLRSV